MRELFSISNGSGGALPKVQTEAARLASCPKATELARLPKPQLLLALPEHALATGSQRPTPAFGELSDKECEPSPSLTERLTMIRAAFGLNHSQMSDLLGVQRKTLYAWMDEESGQKPQAANLQQLDRLEHLARYWRQFLSPDATGALYTPIDGVSVWQHLIADSTAIAPACQAMRSLAKLLRSNRKQGVSSLAQRLRAKGYKAEVEGSARESLII